MPDHFLAIHVGQAEIEKNQVRPDGLNFPHSVLSVADLRYVVARRREYNAESLQDGFFVVNKKYSWTFIQSITSFEEQSPNTAKQSFTSCLSVSFFDSTWSHNESNQLRWMR